MSWFLTLSQLRCFYALGCALYSSTNFEYIWVEDISLCPSISWIACYYDSLTSFPVMCSIVSSRQLTRGKAFVNSF